MEVRSYIDDSRFLHVMGVDSQMLHFQRDDPTFTG